MRDILTCLLLLNKIRELQGQGHYQVGRVRFLDSEQAMEHACQACKSGLLWWFVSRTYHIQDRRLDGMTVGHVTKLARSSTLIKTWTCPHIWIGPAGS